MVSKIVVAVVLIVVVIAAVVVVFSAVPSQTSDVDLYDTGAADGEDVVGGVADSTSAPAGSTPSQPPPPGQPAPAKIGTYSILLTATFVDGTTQTLTGTQGFANVAYYSCKPLKWLQYKGTFKADQAVTVIGGSALSKTNTYFDAYTTKVGSTSRVGYYTAAIASRDVAAGATTTIFNSDQTNFFHPSQVTPTGDYNAYFSVGLKFRYKSNGTESPQFLVTNPIVAITIADESSPPTCGTGGGDGGGSGPRPLILAIADPRIWVAYWRV